MKSLNKIILFSALVSWISRFFVAAMIGLTLGSIIFILYKLIKGYNSSVYDPNKKWGER